MFTIQSASEVYIVHCVHCVVHWTTDQRWKRVLRCLLQVPSLLLQSIDSKPACVAHCTIDKVEATCAACSKFPLCCSLLTASQREAAEMIRGWFLLFRCCQWFETKETKWCDMTFAHMRSRLEAQAGHVKDRRAILLSFLLVILGLIGVEGGCTSKVGRCLSLLGAGTGFQSCAAPPYRATRWSWLIERVWS